MTSIFKMFEATSRFLVEKQMNFFLNENPDINIDHISSAYEYNDLPEETKYIISIIYTSKN